MQLDDEFLAQALMEDAANYLRNGLLDEAAEIMAVAEKLEFGADPFCNLEMDFDGETR